jgi:phage gp36-like protein
MIYVSAEEFEARVGTVETVQLTNLDDPTATTVNANRLELALGDASAEINGYLATRYETPLLNIPGCIKLYCCDIARYRLSENNSPQTYKDKYDSAIARLKDIEKGLMLLVDNTGVAIAQRNDSVSKLIDERGNTLDDFTSFYEPGGVPSFSNIELL